MTDDLFLRLRRSVFTEDPGRIAQDSPIGNGNPQPSGWIYYAPADKQSFSSASTTITASGPIVQVDPTGALTMTSAPTIPDGRDGQQIVLVNVGSGSITIRDQGTLAGSNLRLDATSLTLSPRNSVQLTYLSAIGDWVQTAPLSTVI